MSKTQTEGPAITAILPWFGSNRAMVAEIVEELGPHKSYWEPFCGSMATLLGKPESSHETVNDLHGDLINLARVIQDETLGPRLYRKLRRTLCHEALFAEAKEVYVNCEADPLKRAWAYFMVSWLGRNGVSGTSRVNETYAVRWTSGGGHGGIRFANAVDSIPAWRRRLRRVAILQRDAFELLIKIADQDGTVMYADPPFHRDGARSGSCQYVHDFEPGDHVRLAQELRRFVHVRVVLRYYAHPELAELYPSWTVRNMERQKNLHVQNRRGQGPCKAPEVLLINGPSFLAEPSRRLF